MTMKLDKPALAALRYFQRGHEIIPNSFWLPATRLSLRTLDALRAAGLLKQPRYYPLDLWRITRAGLAALKEVSR